MPSAHEELADLFGRTRDRVEDLIRENAQLKACLRAFEVLGDRPSEKDIQDRLRDSEAARIAAEQRLKEMEEAKTRQQSRGEEIASRMMDLEKQHYSLTNLYVAASQLHSTLDYEAVLRTIQEIVTDLVGAEAMHILVVDEKTGKAEVALSRGVETDVKAVDRGHGKVGKCLETCEPFFETNTQVENATSLENPLAVVPFDLAGQVVGLLSVHKLLKQKTSFSNLDFELFRLLGAQAATAITASRLHSASQRKIATLKGFIEMLKPPTAAEGRRPDHP